MKTNRIELPDPGETVSAVYLAALLDVGVATIHRMHADGDLPPPVSEHPRRWLTAEIRSWIKTRVPGQWRKPLVRTKSK